MADIICNQRAANFFMRHILWLVSQPPNILTLPDFQYEYELSLLSDSLLGFAHETCTLLKFSQHCFIDKSHY